MKQAMTMLYARFIKMLYNDIVGAKIKVQRKISQRQNFLDTVVAVVLVGNFENVCVFGAVAVVVGLMVMLVAAMMNGNLQSRRVN